MNLQVIVLYLVLVIWGWLTIYSASYNYDNTRILDMDIASGRQFLWMGVSFAVAFLIMLVDSRWFFDASAVVYGLVMLLLLVTIFIAPDTKGSRSWLVFGGFSLQPAEFAKFATSLMLATYIGKNGLNLKQGIKDYAVFLIILLPVGLIFLQKETGSALVYLSLLLVLYREGMSPVLLAAGVCAILYFIVGVRFGDVYLWQHTSVGKLMVLLFVQAVFLLMFQLNNRRSRPLPRRLLLLNAVPLLPGCLAAWLWHFNLCYVPVATLALSLVWLLLLSLSKPLRRVALSVFFVVASVAFLYGTDYVMENVLQPHQRTRIEVLLGIIDDPGGAGYNVNQAKISIGSGGFTGKGYMNGTQTKLKYVPEQDTDFIFCTVGEELGFLGSAALVLVYAYLLVCLVLMAERQRNRMVRVYGYCVASIFLFHIVVNLGMVLGILPVIGIPLPFFSYGGSSLLAFTILLFIFVRMDADRFRFN